LRGHNPSTIQDEARRRGLFQTKLITIRADPSHPCRSVFYSRPYGDEARLRGLARAVGLMEIEK